MLVFLVFAHVAFCALVSFSAFVLADYVLDHCQILEPHQSLAHNNIPLAHNWSSNIIIFINVIFFGVSYITKSPCI